MILKLFGAKIQRYFYSVEMYFFSAKIQMSELRYLNFFSYIREIQEFSFCFLERNSNIRLSLLEFMNRTLFLFFVKHQKGMLYFFRCSTIMEKVLSTTRFVIYLHTFNLKVLGTQKIHLLFIIFL